MVIKFFDREAELKMLEDVFKGVRFKSGFVVIYGRRRVGKTELAKKFIEGKKFIWLFVETKSERLILDDLEKEAEKIIGIKPRFGNWDEFLDFIFSKKDIILVFDEFQNFSKIDSAFFSKMQRRWDEHHRKSRIMIIAIGSYVGMMKKLFYDSKEPLFGRADAMLNLKPFNFVQTCGFLKSIGVGMKKEDVMKVYSLLGGVPKYLLYLAQFSLKTPDDVIENLFLKPPGILMEEGKNILAMEFGSEHRGYFSILEAISAGKVLPKEISDYTSLEKDTVAKYLHELYHEYEILKKELPVTEDRTRDTRYFIRDNFFNFWFRFIYRNAGRIELGSGREIFGEINSFFGRTFEDAAAEFISAQKLPFAARKIGRWWRKDREIDIIALNEKTKNIAFFEVKWQNLERKDAEKILAGLKEKSAFVGWNLTARKEYFGIVAKKIKGKAELRKSGYLAFDLDDF